MSGRWRAVFIAVCALAIFGASAAASWAAAVCRPGYYVAGFRSGRLVCRKLPEPRVFDANDDFIGYFQSVDDINGMAVLVPGLSRIVYVRSSLVSGGIILPAFSPPIYFTQENCTGEAYVLPLGPSLLGAVFSGPDGNPYALEIPESSAALTHAWMLREQPIGCTEVVDLVAPYEFLRVSQVTLPFAWPIQQPVRVH